MLSTRREVAEGTDKGFDLVMLAVDEVAEEARGRRGGGVVTRRWRSPVEVRAVDWRLGLGFWWVLSMWGR